MKKAVTTIAVTLALATPALASTEADIQNATNGIPGSPASVTEQNGQLHAGPFSFAQGKITEQ